MLALRRNRVGKPNYSKIRNLEIELGFYYESGPEDVFKGIPQAQFYGGGPPTATAAAAILKEMYGK